VEPVEPVELEPVVEPAEPPVVEPVIEPETAPEAAPAAAAAAAEAAASAVGAAAGVGAGAGAGVGAAAGVEAGAGAGDSDLPQAARPTAATSVARTSDFFISGFLLWGEKQFPEIVLQHRCMTEREGLELLMLSHTL